jgi:hypothetical protein
MTTLPAYSLRLHESTANEVIIEVDMQIIVSCGAGN